MPKSSTQTDRQTLGDSISSLRRKSSELKNSGLISVEYCDISFKAVIQRFFVQYEQSIVTANITALRKRQINSVYFPANTWSRPTISKLLKNIVSHTTNTIFSFFRSMNNRIHRGAWRRANLIQQSVPNLSGVSYDRTEQLTYGELRFI